MRKQWLCCFRKCCVDKMSQFAGKHFVSCYNREMVESKPGAPLLIKSCDSLLTIYEGKSEKSTLCEIPHLSLIPPIPRHELAAPDDRQKLPKSECFPLSVKETNQEGKMFSFPTGRRVLSMCACICSHRESEYCADSQIPGLGQWREGGGRGAPQTQV